MNRIFLLLACLAGAALRPALAGTPAHQDKELHRIIGLIQSADGYCYQLTTGTELLDSAGGRARPGATGPARSSLRYTSRAEMVLFASSGAETVFACTAGFLRADSSERLLHYHAFADDADRRSFLAQSPADGGAALMDSLLFRSATIVSRKQQAGKLVYRLSYPCDWKVREAELVYDKTTGFLSSLEYVLETEADRAAPGRRPPVLRQRVTMSGYRRRPPEAAAVLLHETASDGFSALLSHRFAGYRLISQ